MNLAKYIDHTLLKPEATEKQITQLCREALSYGFWSVCISSANVLLCAQLLKNSQVKICSVAGFPHGNQATLAKASEAEQALLGGASEIDMVINIGWLKGRRLDAVLSDIKTVAGICQSTGALLKVIIETGLLSDAEKELACKLAEEAGAHFVKTCTGFGPGQATVADIKLMAAAVSPHIGVKASGGIRDRKTACEMIQAGAKRLGTSASVKIMESQ